MDLKNYKIKFGTLLSDEKAKAVLMRAFPMWADSPLLTLAQSMPLEKVIRLAERHVDKEKLTAVLRELEML